MNDIRRTILWVIFGFSMVLLWDQWQVFNGRQATFFPSATQTAKAPAATASAAGAAKPDASVPSSIPASATPTTSAVVPTGAPSTTPAAAK